MITRADIDLLADGLISIDRLASENLQALLELLFSAGVTLEEVRDSLGEEMVALAEVYAQTAGAHAAQWYEMLRERESVPQAYFAQVPDLIDAKELRRDIRRDMRFAFAGDEAATKQALGDSFSKRVRAASRKTVAHNVASDPAKPAWARVPKGTETCAFCDMMASRGFVYSSPESAGEGAANRFHAHCDCAIVPIWDEGKVEIEGYDPEVFKARYDAAVESLGAKFPPELGINFDERWVVREMNILFPDVYGFKGARAGDVPFDARKPMELTQKDIRHIWEGETSPKKGGHKPGLGRLGKTEYPQGYSKQQMVRAVYEAYWYGRHKTFGENNDALVSAVIDGYLISGWVHKDNKIGSFYPVAGDKIIDNRPEGAVEVPLKNHNTEGVPRLYGHEERYRPDSGNV